MNDEAVRKEALNPYKSFIVQAPAGSGKTQLLTLRLLSLLAYRVEKPESILAITFTRKAAQEMKRRVISALLLAQKEAPAHAHELALWKLARVVLKVDQEKKWDLLQNPQRLRIMTIDAFCSSVTHQLPLSSRMGANPSCVENAEALYKQAAQNIINALLNEKNEAIEILLLHLNNNQENACRAIANMLSLREQWLGLIYSHDTENLKTLRAILELSILKILKNSFDLSMQQAWSVDWDGLSLYLSYAADHLDTSSQQDEVRSWMHLSDDMQDFEKWRSLCQWLCTVKGELRKTVDKKQGFPAPSNMKDKEAAAYAKNMKEGFIAWLDHVRENDEACEAIKELTSLPDPFYTDQQWDVLKALFHILPRAVEQLYLLFESRGETDFSAISRCALTALGGDNDPTDLDLKLDHALHHILVDEFQDTSAPQFELIRRLVCHWENNAEKTLFLVGDPMQSIYRFRQAEVGGFLQAQQFGVGPIRLESLHLKSNFRSEKPIIDFVNQYMPSAFSKKEDIYLGAISYASFEAQIDHHPSAGVFLKSLDEQEGLGEAFLKTLTPLLDDGTIQSIAILVRNRGHIEEILPVLRKNNIPYQAVEIEKITQTPCVRQLFQLTSAYLNIANSEAWLSVLMSPYCGLSLADLTYLKNRATTYWEALLQWETILEISDVGKHILRRVAPVFIAWMAQKNRLPLARAIEGAWLALGGPAALPNVYHLADAKPFFDLLHRCDQGGTLNIIDFELQLNKLYSNAFAASKIQVMTIHRAKGLEFDAVLIPSLEKQPKASEKPLLLWESCSIGMEHIFLLAPVHATKEERDPIYEFIWKKHKIREKHEAARLLYVALTRAKKQLYLFSEPGKLRENSFLALLSSAFPVADKRIEKNEDDADSSVTEMIPLSYILKRLHPSWKNPFGNQRVGDGRQKLCDGREEIIEKTLLSENPIDHDLILPSRYDEKTLGTFIHQELYYWAEHPGLIDKPIEKHFQRWMMMLREAALPAHHLDWVQKVMTRVQQDPTARFLLSPHQDAQSEYEITVSLKGKTKTYIMDRTFIDAEGVRVIVDYKTANFIDSESMWAQYREQLESYAAAMRTLENKPVKLCLYFPVSGDYIEKRNE